LIPEKAAEAFTVTLSGLPERKEINLLTVKGCLDTTTAPDFEKIFQSALNQKKFKLVIDLKDAEYISSAGWGIFVSELKRIRLGKGDLVLSGMRTEVQEIFELLEFDTFLRSFPNVETAVEKGFHEITPFPVKKSTGKPG
jgi:anti-sigma B factor antagonist